MKHWPRGRQRGRRRGALSLGNATVPDTGPPVLTLSGSPVLTATEDSAYAGFTVTASNGTAPYVYSLVGTWPTGITINSSTGEVSGTPTESGTFASLSVRVTDDVLDTDDLPTFTLEVAAAAVGDALLIEGTTDALLIEGTTDKILLEA